MRTNLVPANLVPANVASLGEFVDAGVLGEAEIHTASTFATAVPDTPFEVLLGAALAVRAPLHGSVCIHLPDVRDTIVIDDGSTAGTAAADPDDAAPAAVSLPWPDPVAWADALRASPLVRAIATDGDDGDDGDGDGSTGAEAGPVRLRPLVLDGDRLYLARFHALECFLADALLQRSAPRSGDDPTAVAAAATADAVAELFAVASRARGSEPDAAQVAAARAVAERDFVVIAGGPGTGKTTTVAHLLAGLAQARPADAPEPRLALAAPTGKAAARMTEALHAAADSLAGVVTDGVAEGLGEIEAQTIHRLLGTGRRRGFWHDAANPLPHDLVIVDESSMVSLSLMAHLLAAIRPDAKVVLVGDPHQLTSVEAGAVLGDIVGSSGSSGSGSSAVAGSIRMLDVVHRQGEDSPILPLATAIREGRTDAVVAQLRAPASADVEWIEIPDDTAPAGAAATRLEALVASVLDDAIRAIAAAEAGAVDDALRAIVDTKVLCATRQGPLGVEGWNRTIDDRLRRRGLIGREPWHAGRPVMVTQNDYVKEVFNGEVGVAIPSGASSKASKYKVCFARADGIREIDAVRLDRVVTQWALSIHKSQGSEFAHAVVVLPRASSRILTRELFYTGVTRAKQRITVVASEAALRAAVDRPVSRASGLADRLR